MRKKTYAARVLAAVLAGTMILPGCSGQTETAAETDTAAEESRTEASSEAQTETQTEAAAEDAVEKPEKITFMVDGTLVTKANGQEEWVNRWEELTGIQLEIIQPDHTAYYDVLGQTIASGPDNWPDVLITTSQYYTNYAKEGVLWDMTEAWENSEIKSSGRIVNEDVVNSLYIDDHLYGLATGPGMGCITYIKKQWLDNVGLDVPTTYEEYIEVLDAFTNGDPDGNGVDGDTFGVSAAGFINGEAPYVQYLPEFWQDAYPTFYQKEDGTWVDGFTEDSMKEAIQRLQDAYNAGYIEKETLTNATSDCRTKFWENKFGIFTYWPGSWQKRLSEGLETNGYDGELTTLKYSIIADCVTQGLSVEEGMQRFEEEGGAEWSQIILDSLNNLNN